MTRIQGFQLDRLPGVEPLINLNAFGQQESLPLIVTFASAPLQRPGFLTRFATFLGKTGGRLALSSQEPLTN